MNRYFLSIRTFSVLAALMTALFAGGCGGGSDDIAVQTGSLSKAEFIKQADTICKAARTEFIAKYETLVRANKSAFGNPEQESALIDEVRETILSPNYESQIEKISALGAPSDYAPEVESFLDALQKRLSEINEHPEELDKTPYPFKGPEKIAKTVGLKGCADSFS